MMKILIAWMFKGRDKFLGSCHNFLKNEIECEKFIEITEGSNPKYIEICVDHV